MLCLPRFIMMPFLPERVACPLQKKEQRTKNPATDPGGSARGAPMVQRLNLERLGTHPPDQVTVSIFSSAASTSVVGASERLPVVPFRNLGWLVQVLQVVGRHLAGLAVGDQLVADLLALAQ